MYWGHGMTKHPRKLHLSVSLPTSRDEPDRPASWHEMRALAQQAEAIGLDAIFVPDHSGFDFADGPRAEFWDGWTLLPALAEVTSRVMIGPFVTTPLLHHPVALARMASTLDEVSSGRVLLALGAAGPIERAVRVLGLPAERLYSRFEEAIQIIALLLRNGEVDFRGRYFEAHEAILGPRGPQGTAIPIWIGARGPRMMRLAAQWADTVNFMPPLSSLDAVHTLMSQFEDACRDAGRDPSVVEKTGWARLTLIRSDAGSTDTPSTAITGDPEQIAAQLHTFHRAGVSHISCWVDAGEWQGRRRLPPLSVRGLEFFARVIAALRTREAEGTGD